MIFVRATYLRPQAAIRNVVAAALCFLPWPAAAHMPVSTGAFEGGLTHPLLSLEHALAFAAVGFWAGQLGGRAHLRVPVTFLFAIWLGLVLNLRLVALPFVDIVNFVSLIVFGGLVAAQARPNWLWACAIAGVFGIFHGFANASAMPLQWAPGSFAAGTAAAGTAVMVLCSLATAKLNKFPLTIVFRVAGSWVAATGLLMLAFTYTQSQ